MRPYSHTNVDTLNLNYIPRYSRHALHNIVLRSHVVASLPTTYIKERSRTNNESQRITTNHKTHSNNHLSDTQDRKHHHHSHTSTHYATEKHKYIDSPTPWASTTENFCCCNYLNYPPSPCQQRRRIRTGLQTLQTLHSPSCSSIEFRGRVLTAPVAVRILSGWPDR